jgi:hypothetical protein
LDGKIRVQPPLEDARKLAEFFLLLDHRFPFWFNIVVPDRAAQRPFQVCSAGKDELNEV